MAPHRMGHDWKFALFGGIVFNVPGLIDWVLTPVILDASFLYQFSLKLGSTIVLGAAGALSTLIVKDIYRKVKTWYKNRGL